MGLWAEISFCLPRFACLLLKLRCSLPNLLEMQILTSTKQSVLQLGVLLMQLLLNQTWISSPILGAHTAVWHRDTGFGAPEALLSVTAPHKANRPHVSSHNLEVSLMILFFF